MICDLDTSWAGKPLEYLCRQGGLDPEIVLERLLSMTDSQHQEEKTDDH